MSKVTVDLKFMPTEQVSVDGHTGFTITGANIRAMPNGELDVPFYQVSWFHDGDKNAYIEEYRIKAIDPSTMGMK